MPGMPQTQIDVDAAIAQYIASKTAGSSTTSEWITVKGGDGYTYLVNKTTGEKRRLDIPPDAPSAPANGTKNRVLASGSSPTDRYIVILDENGDVHTERNPNYVPPKGPNTVPGSGTPGTVDYSGTSTGGSDPSGPSYQPGTPDLPVDVFNAQTERQKLEAAQRKAETDAADARSKNQYDMLQKAADNEYRRLTLQVQQGQLSNSQAIAEFDRFWKINVEGPKTQLDAQTSLYASGLAAGQDAAKLAELGTKDLVGPGFGANFADALTGLATGDRSKVHFGAGDFTYQVPDYSAIAKSAAAAAIAHLSPYAASIAGTAAPSGYQPPAQQPGVAPQVAVAPNPSPIQPPPYKPAGFVG